MWYEMLPAFGIVMTFLHLPQVAMYFCNNLYLGNTYNRRLDNFDQYHHFLRDMRISGSMDAYVQKNNLDCWVPEPEPEKKCECP